METINLNFFGEQVTIDTPKDLNTLRTKISEKYSLSSSDSAEIILFYTKDSKKVYIINGNDFDKFKESKISTIFLDVNQNSKLFLDNASQIKEETKEKKTQEVVDIEKEKKEIEKLKLEKEEIFKKEREKKKLYDDKLSEIIKQRVELEKIESELSLERDLDMCEFRDQRHEIDIKIEEIQKKIEPKKEEKEEVNLKAAPKPEKKGDI